MNYTRDISQESRWSPPDPTPGLFLIAAASSLLYYLGGMTWAAISLPCIVLLPTFVYVLSRNSTFALAAIIISSAIPRYSIGISGSTIRPEYIVTGLTCAAAIFIRRGSNEKPGWIFPDLLVVGFVAANVYSSLFQSIDPGQTFKWSLHQMLVVIPYFLIRIIADSRAALRRAVNILLVTGAIEGAYAVLCFYSNLIFGTTFGVEPGQYGNIPGIYGTQLEANILGSYSGACFIMMLVMYLHSRQRKYLWGMGCAYAGLIISLSRAAIGATALALFVFAIYSIKRNWLSRATIRRVAVPVLIVTLFIGASTIPMYMQRFSTLEVSDLSADDNTRVRLLTMGEATVDIAQHPILGSGTASFQLGFDYKDFGYGDVDVNGWIGNTELRILHDTGIIGLAVFAWFLIFVGVKGIRAAKLDPDPGLVGLLLSAVVYCISFQATEGSMMTFPWIHIGLVASFLSLHPDGPVPEVLHSAKA